MYHLFFKHSFRCPISLAAKKEVQKFLDQNKQDIEFEEIDVINNRERSMEIADLFNIQHQSPQLIISSSNNELIFHTSHWDITATIIHDTIDK